MRGLMVRKLQQGLEAGLESAKRARGACQDDVARKRSRNAWVDGENATEGLGGGSRER